MNELEREEIIAQLAFAEGCNKQAFEKLTDEQLQERLTKLFGDDTLCQN